MRFRLWSTVEYPWWAMRCGRCDDVGTGRRVIPSARWLARSPSAGVLVGRGRGLLPPRREDVSQLLDLDLLPLDGVATDGQVIANLEALYMLTPGCPSEPRATPMFTILPCPAARMQLPADWELADREPADREPANWEPAGREQSAPADESTRVDQSS